MKFFYIAVAAMAVILTANFAYEQHLKTASDSEFGCPYGRQPVKLPGIAEPVCQSD